MRLNRGTLILLAVSLVVIVAMLVLSNQPAAAPESNGVTPTPGPLFAGLDSGAVTRIEVVSAADSATTVLAKDDQGLWRIETATNSTERATDQTLVLDKVGKLSALSANDSFTAADVASFDLANYGLAEPAYTITVAAGTDTSTAYVLRVGGKNATGTRYYALLGDDTATVLQMNATTLDEIIGLIAAPPYVAAPTATPTFTPSPNPYSEVEQTATAAVQQTATAQFTPEATAEATAEVTEEEASASTAEATAEVTGEATAEATTSP